MTLPAPCPRPTSPGAQLWKAVRANDLEQAKGLLAAGTSPNLVHSGDCLLSRALLHPELAMARLLMAAGAKLDGPCSDGSLLTRASRQGHFALYGDFHAAGVDLSAPLTAHFERGMTTAGAAARHQNANALRLLHSLGVDIRFSAHREHAREMTLIAWCESSPRSKTHDGRDGVWWEVVQLLLNQPVDEEGACQLASDIVMKSGYLTGPTNGVLERFKKSAWWTRDAQRIALIQSIERGHNEQTDRLLDEGLPLDANPSRHGPYTETALAAEICQAMREKKRPRRFARAAKRVDSLIAKGASAKVTQQGWLLHLWAIAERDVPYVPIIRALCKAGADPCAGQPAAEEEEAGLNADRFKHWTGSTLAHFFAFDLKAKDLKALFKDTPQAVNLQDDEGVTPLFRALMPRFQNQKVQQRVALPTVLTLLSAGANPGICTNSGNNVLHGIAMSYRHGWTLVDFEEVVVTLLQACPQLWAQTNDEGTPAYRALLETPALADNPLLLARMNEARFDRILPTAADTTGSKPRF